MDDKKEILVEKEPVVSYHTALKTLVGGGIYVFDGSPLRPLSLKERIMSAARF